MSSRLNLPEILPFTASGISTSITLFPPSIATFTAPFGIEIGLFPPKTTLFIVASRSKSLILVIETFPFTSPLNVFVPEPEAPK